MAVEKLAHPDFAEIGPRPPHFFDVSAAENSRDPYMRMEFGAHHY
jgi:hypothetical protein